jgi:hypothetical protein
VGVRPSQVSLLFQKLENSGWFQNVAKIRRYNLAGPDFWILCLIFNNTQLFYKRHSTLVLKFLEKLKNSKTKKIGLLSCSVGSWLHFKTSPSFLAFEIPEKFGTDGHPRLDPRS